MYGTVEVRTGRWRMGLAGGEAPCLFVRGVSESSVGNAVLYPGNGTMKHEDVRETSRGSVPLVSSTTRLRRRREAKM